MIEFKSENVKNFNLGFIPEYVKAWKVNITLLESQMINSVTEATTKYSMTTGNDVLITNSRHYTLNSLNFSGIQVILSRLSPSEIEKIEITQ